MRYKFSIPATTLLIGLTILVITAFQAHWLRKNYQEEKARFSFRTNALFRATVLHLEASKLRLDTSVNLQLRERDDITHISSVLKEKVRGTTAPGQLPRRTMLFTMEGAAGEAQPDIRYRIYKSGPEEKVFAFLEGMDSLRDPITVTEIATSYHKILQRQKPKIDVPFSIKVIPLDTFVRAIPRFPDDLEDNTVTVGFSNPVSYMLSFENNTWYLLKQISQPILFSVCLLGITMLSFLLLYRNMHQQQKLSQLKNDFINNITHELKTPIATVSVAIEALRNFDMLEDQQSTNEYLEISANEMQRLSTLVDKVLNLSMFEHHDISFSKEQLDLSALARNVLASMKLQFESRHAIAQFKTTGSNFTIIADKLHMAGVLYNLLDNALKYTIQDPQILVHIIDHKQYVEMRVSDNGKGIAKEYRKKIFDKFFRVPGGNRHNVKGYGLGLSYVWHIVQSHTGLIEVESEVNKGSIFSIKLKTGYERH